MIEYEDLRGDGRIVMYLRPAKVPKYYVRLKVPGATGYKTISTKTSDRSEAVQLARDFYDDLRLRVKSGGSLKSNTYGDVFKKWKLSRQNSFSQEKKIDRTVEYVETYSLGYFGKTAIEELSTKDFHVYWDWRKINFLRKKPTNETLNRERTAIQNLLKFALQNGYRTSPLPILKLETKGINRRPTFTDGEWKKITVGMRKWVEAGKPHGHWRERYTLQQYVLLLSNSGIRIGEMRSVRWDDVSSETNDNDKVIVIKVNGKTGTRDVVCNPSSEKYLERIYDLRKDDLGGLEPPLSEPVFVNPHTDRPITSFKVGFNSMLRYCDVPIEKSGKNRTLYSLRHFYATKRLQGNFNIYFLAKNMGTSVEMIEKFYGHVVTPDFVEAIKKSTDQKSWRTTDKKYPF